MVIVNPDNPSGNYLPKKDVIKLAEWTSENNIELIYDESFVDFSEENDSTMISDELLEQFSNLMIIKSISKSYGVPGFRLGIAASSQIDKIQHLKQSVAIWNINSFGEFYLQIAEKYKKDYYSALDKLKEARRILFDDLTDIKGVRVFSSQANYIMIELCNGKKAVDVCSKMLSESNILIKDLTKKFDYIGTDRQLIRIAVRTKRENKVLSDNLKVCVEQ